MVGSRRPGGSPSRRRYCLHVECPQRIFCERIPTFVAPYARRTLRLNEALGLIGLAVGGEAGSRLAIALGMSVSPDTIIQRIRQIQLSTPPTPKVIGVDDWAKHKGQSYGTMVLVQFFGRRQTEPIFNFSLCDKHCFPYM